MLQVLLGEHPQVSTTVEITLFTRYVSPWLKTWDEEKRNSVEGRWNQGLPFVWEREEVASFLKDFIQRVYAKLQARKPGATHVLDKNPTNAMQTSVIRDFQPNARFVHVIRDGRDVACSMVSAAQKIGFGTSTIRESAVAWKRHVLAAREAARYGSDYMEVRYEALVRDGVSAYQGVLEFCGLKYEKEWIASVIENNTFGKMKAARRTGDPTIQSNEAHYRSGTAGTWKEVLSVDEGLDFERLAGDLLRELGYETSTAWWETSPSAAWLARLRAEARRRLRGLRKAARRVGAS